MKEALYRRYRSQNFDELVGQPHITELLKNAVLQDKISHAYLLVGSRGTGKTSTARILAKAVNCSKISKVGNPCNKCDSCIAINEGRYLDLIEIDAASNRGIDQIRELKERIEFSPSEGKYKVYIIDEVHMLTTEAFNALLKTLEEPPSHVIFILATTEVHKLPATILSRCQRYDFLLGADSEVEKLIRDVAKKDGYRFEQSAIDRLVKSANGSYRDALSLMDVVISGQMDSKNPKEISEEEVRNVLGMPDSVMVVEFLNLLIAGKGSKALSLLKEVEERGIDLSQFIKLMLEILRESMISNITLKNIENKYPFTKNLDRKDLVQIINLCIEAERSLKHTPIPILAVEILIPEVLDLLEIETVESDSSCDSTFEPKKGGGKSLEDIGDSKEDSDSENDKVEPSIENSSKNDLEKKRSSISKVIQSTKKVGEKVQKKILNKDNDDDISHVNKDFRFGTIEKKWDNIKASVKEKNGHLYALLRNSELAEVKNGVLKIRVTYEFHKDRLECIQSREIMMESFRDILGAGMKYECIVDNEFGKKRSKISKESISNGIPKVYEESFMKGSDKSNKSADEKRDFAQKKSKEKNGNGLTRKKVEEIFAGL
ncbi:MAG TPA: DNA polymerase III subunit gamma/tau [bacterium]|nr:DNA polymerase III subunit gamma/tau [bacterium]